MQDPTGLPAREQWLFAGLAAFVAVLWLATLGSRPLFNPDEGRYAEIPREMLVTGEWVIPHLDGVPYLEKPPLTYWATALGLELWGNNEFGARFYTALCALGTLLIGGTTAAALWGRAAGWRAAAALAGMLMFVVMGQLLTLDMSLTGWLTASLAAFLLAQHATDAVARRWMLLAWAATAGGVMTKGLVAAALPVAVLGLYSLIARDMSPWRRSSAALGLPLFLLLCLPWHGWAALREPGFLQFFFVHEHLARYLTPSADREEPAWYFVPVFLLGCLPWTGAVLREALSGWRGALRGRRDAPSGRGGGPSGRRGVPSGRPGAPSGGGGLPEGGRVAAFAFDTRLFLRIWALFVIGFFSVSDSKLIPYILPALPAAAWLVASSSLRALRRDVLIAAGVSVAAGAVLGVLSVEAPMWLAGNVRRDYFLPLARPLREIAALLAVSGAWVLVRRRRDVTEAMMCLGVAWCVGALLLMRAAAAVTPLYSGVDLARALPAIPIGTPVFSVATYDQTLPFYWRRTLSLVAYRGELDFGLRHAGGIDTDVATFIARWQGEAQAYAVMENATFEDLTGRGVPMREIARNAHRVLVARR